MILQSEKSWICLYSSDLKFFNLQEHLLAVSIKLKLYVEDSKYTVYCIYYQLVVLLTINIAALSAGDSCQF